MLQKCAVLAPSCGRVSSWKSLAVVGIEAEIELILPAELETRLAERVVASLSAGMALGEIGGVSGDLVGDDAVLHVLRVGQVRGVPSGVT